MYPETKRQQLGKTQDDTTRWASGRNHPSDHASKASARDALQGLEELSEASFSAS